MSNPAKPAAEKPAADATEEVRLLRGYVPAAGPISGGIKQVAGEVVSLPRSEAKRLVNLGAAQFTETE